MGVKLDTGKILAGGAKSKARVTEYDDTRSSEWVIFPSEERSLIKVEPNTTVIVTGYNISRCSEVHFRKVLRSKGIPAHGTSECCPTVTLAKSVRLYSVDIPCWKLDRCNPIFVLKTPGDYEVDVWVGEDTTGSEIIITATTFPMQPVNRFWGCECEE